MTDTQKFFIECVKKGINNQQVESLPTQLDYKDFFALCATHAMCVVVFKALQNVVDKLPPQFLTALRDDVFLQIKLDVQSEYDVNALLSAFEERDIKYMPLKGYHLKKLYPSTDMRYSSDVDVLIDKDQLKQVRVLVSELGLETKRRDEHHDIVYQPTTKTIFELHKTLFVGPLEKYFGINNEPFEKAEVKQGYKCFYQMGKELFYISMLAHSAYHFAEGAGVGIRHLTDIYLYRKANELNEEYLNSELEKCNLLTFKNEFEKAAFYLFANGEADHFTLTLCKHVLQSSLFSNNSSKDASTVVSQLKEGETNEKTAKKRSFWRAIFPAKEKMQFSYPVLKKQIWLLPLFYVVRWFHVLFTRPKNVSKLKRMNAVDSEQLSYVKKLRDGLDINHLG